MIEIYTARSAFESVVTPHLKHLHSDSDKKSYPIKIIKYSFFVFLFIYIFYITGTVLLWGPVLRAVPITVLFGVFLYLGVSAISGVQLYKRIKLLLMPVKHHPGKSYVRRVSISVFMVKTNI